MEFLDKQWHDYTGLSPSETIGWGYQVAFHPEDRKNGIDRCRFTMKRARLSRGTEQAQTLKPSSKPKKG
jgi:hypothetical protein